jgi:putative proteasome-type protease
LRSNISVGLPLDLLVYETDRLAVTRFVTINEKNQYFQMIRDTWGHQLKTVFEAIDDPVWDATPEVAHNVLSSTNMHSKPVRVLPPLSVQSDSSLAPTLQSLAQNFGDSQQ